MTSGYFLAPTGNSLKQQKSLTILIIIFSSYSHLFLKTLSWIAKIVNSFPKESGKKSLIKVSSFEKQVEMVIILARK